MLNIPQENCLIIQINKDPTFGKACWIFLNATKQIPLTEKVLWW